MFIVHSSVFDEMRSILIKIHFDGQFFRTVLLAEQTHSLQKHSLSISVWASVSVVIFNARRRLYEQLMSQIWT